MSYPELTPEEKAKREEVSELRKMIAGWVIHRRMIKAAYRLPHGSTENLEAMKKAREVLKLVTYSYNAHCTPARHLGKDILTEHHIELATLRGKVHGKKEELQLTA